MAKVHILRYLWEVRLALPGSRKRKKKLLTIVEASVRELAIENPNADYRTLVNSIGDPRKIAESCVVEMEPSELLDGMQVRSRLLLIVCITATVLMIMRFGFSLASYLSFQRDVNGYAVVEVIEIERETFSEGNLE